MNIILILLRVLDNCLSKVTDSAFLNNAMGIKYMFLFQKLFGVLSVNGFCTLFDGKIEMPLRFMSSFKQSTLKYSSLCCNRRVVVQVLLIKEFPRTSLSYCEEL